MRTTSKSWDWRSEEGKGVAGCLFSLAVLALAAFVGIMVGPDYYAYRSLETDVKTEVSRAGAQFHDNDTLLANILSLAKKNDIPLKRDQVKIDRFAGQLHVSVSYRVPVDLVVYQTVVTYDIKASSFVGRL